MQVLNAYQTSSKEGGIQGDGGKKCNKKKSWCLSNMRTNSRGKKR